MADLIGALGVRRSLAAAAAPFMPPWLISLASIAFANALVVLGLIVLWRAGLVSFGQALYYCIGAYTVALIGALAGLNDALVLVLLGGIAAGMVSFLRRLPARALSRDFLRHAQPGVVDDPLWRAGENGVARLDRRLHRRHAEILRLRAASDATARSRCSGWCSALARWPRCWSALYFRTIAGALALPIRDNEIRVEFLGMSVTHLIHVKLVIAGVLGGLGGALAALTIGHVDPDMAVLDDLRRLRVRDNPRRRGLRRCGVRRLAGF